MNAYVVFFLAIVSLRMPDYKLRAELYENGFIQDFKKLRFYARYFSLHHYDEACADIIDILTEMQRLDPVTFDEVVRAAASDRNRNARLKNKIRKMLSMGKCVFLTLTFTDEVLSSTTSAQRRLYVIRFLKSQSKSYIANIDYGANNNREHYHAIIVGSADFSGWTFGNIDGRKIAVCSNPSVLASYISKLCNHSVKQTTKRNHIIYSRRSPA